MLDDVSLEALQSQFEQTEEPEPAARLRVAIEYKRGATIELLASRYDVTDATVRKWLGSFEESPVEQAPYETGGPTPGTPQTTDPSAEPHNQESDSGQRVVLPSHRKEEPDVWKDFRAIRAIVCSGALVGIAVGAGIGRAVGSEAAIGGLGIWFGIAGGVIGGAFASRRYGR
jgi:transposase-like protein